MTEFRCPSGRHVLFAKREGEFIEIACSDCRRTLRLIGARDVRMVIHKYTLDGELVDTFTVMEGD